MAICFSIFGENISYGFVTDVALHDFGFSIVCRHQNREGGVEAVYVTDVSSSIRRIFNGMAIFQKKRNSIS